MFCCMIPVKSARSIIFLFFLFLPPFFLFLPESAESAVLMTSDLKWSKWIIL